MDAVRRRWWTAAVTLVAGVLVLGALLTALFQVVMLLAPGYREDLAQYVSRVANQPVDIGGVGLGWRGLAPRLELTDIILYGEDGSSPALIAERLRLGFGLGRLLRGDTTPQRVELSGLALFARIDEQGRFSLRGLDTAGGPARARQDWLRQLGRFQSVRLSRCELHLDDARLRGPAPRFRLREAELRFADGRGQASGDLQLPPVLGAGVRFSAQVAGDLENPDSWSGRWNARVEGLRSFPWLMPYLAEDAEVAFDDTTVIFDGRLEAGTLAAVSVQLDAGRVRGRRGEDPAVAELRQLSLQARLDPRPQGWDLDLSRLRLDGRRGPWPEAQARVRLQRGDAGDLAIQADAEYLGLDDLAPWLSLLPGERPEAPVYAGIGGAARAFVLRWQRPAVVDGAEPPAAHFSLRADLESLGVQARQARPGFDGLSGSVVATETGGQMRLTSTPLSIEAPSVWLEPVYFDAVSSEVDWTRTERGWTVQARNTVAELAGARGEGDLRLQLGSDLSPSIDLDVRFSAPDVRPFKAYVPQFWAGSLRQWLDRALVRGRVSAGRLRIEGRLADFPFVEAPGRFALDVDGADTELAFAPDWPALKELAGRLEIRGRSLTVRAAKGRVMGNAIDEGEARIDNLLAPELSVRGQAQGEIAHFYDYLRASPLAPQLAGLLSRTTARGDSLVQVKLDVPLREMERTQVRGQVRLRDVELEVAGVPEPVIGLYGDVLFDNHGAYADEIHGEMFETQLLASIRRDAQRNMRLFAHFDFKPNAEGRGLSRVLPAFLHQGLSGSTRWTAEVPIRSVRSGEVILRSELRGLASDLPQPLAKEAGEPWPTTVTLAADEPYALRLGVEIAGRFGADLAFLGDEPGHLTLDRARLRTGGGPRPVADAFGIHVSGSVAELEPLSWVGALTRGSSGAGARDGSGVGALPVHADLQVARLWLGTLFSQGVHLRHEPAAGGWQTRFDGAGAEGQLVYRGDEAGGTLRARLSRAQLGWNPRHGESQAARRPPRTTATHPPTDPAALPRLDLRIDDLRLGQAEMGALELHTERIEHGQRLVGLRSQGPDGRLDVQGQWQRRDARSSAHLTASFDSTAIEDVLGGLGYAPTLSARRSHVEATLDWPEDAPTAIQGLNWALGRGTLSLAVEDGVLRAVEPGAGRVLGLINFWAIPRRLSLNFGDVLSKGLAFDRMRGSFSIADGVASTGDLDLDAPALGMEVRGRVGLLARNYDQHVKVVPDVSAGVTLGALLLGGPAAGIVALIAQEMLDQPLDQVGQLNYHLTGSWDDPQVDRVSAGAAGASRSAAPAPRTFSPGHTP